MNETSLMTKSSMDQYYKTIFIVLVLGNESGTNWMYSNELIGTYTICTVTSQA